MRTPENLSAALFANNRVSIAYTDPMIPELPLMLDCYRPDTHTPDKPLLLAHHSKGHDGAHLRELWVPAADRHGLLVVAISFPLSSKSDGETYSEGYVRDATGIVRPRQNWALGVPGRVFALLRATGLTTRDKAHLWGYSAGGQFVLRLMATQPHDIFAAVGVASTGWYTMPSLDIPFPEGFGGLGLTPEDIEKFLAYPMEIFAGEHDTGRDNLRANAMAQSQGTNRLERAERYAEIGRAEAARRGVACNWKFVVAPDVGHMGRFMSAFTAGHWFGSKG